MTYGNNIKSLGEDPYKYLRILQADIIKHTEVKKVRNTSEE